MRTPLVVGNWKMNLDRAQSVKLAAAVVEGSGNLSNVDLAVCPPFVYLDAVGKEVAGSKIGLGAQNIYFEGNGAFTGEVSAAMLLDLGCRYVILGHSERRHQMGETDAQVNRKIVAALGAGLTPILCVGETLTERQAGSTSEVVRRQLTGSLAGLSAEQVSSVILAYEPVWAIGTGQVATPSQAEEVHLDLRKMLTDGYNAAVAQKLRILYGGSVNGENAAQLIGQPNVDGALVGGASLKADGFLKIADAATRCGGA